MKINTQVGASIGAICGNCGYPHDPLLNLNYMQLCYNSDNGINLALIGSSDRDALPEQVELVSTHAKCISINLNQIATVVLPEQVELASAPDEYKLNVNVKHFHVSCRT